MAVRAEALVLNVGDSRRGAEFWARAPGYKRGADAPDFLAPPQGQGVRSHLDERDRTHLDLFGRPHDLRLGQQGRPDGSPNAARSFGRSVYLRVGESARLYDLLEEALTVDSKNATAKASRVVGGMLALPDAQGVKDLAPLLTSAGER